jgi:hypothetical protein
MIRASTLGVVRTLACLIALLALGGGPAIAEIREAGPQPLSATRSIGDVIRSAGATPVHVIFIHGMRAEGPGASSRFIERLTAWLPGGPVTIGRTGKRLAIGPRPDLTFAGQPIWRSDAEWEASRPFVERVVLTRREGAPVVIDEINWWPLLFPLKCRFLVAPEGRLAGPDKKHLELCARSDPPYAPWLSPAELRAALRPDPALGPRGALINRSIKQQILDWGLSDAVIALGPMRDTLHASMREAFAYAGSFTDSGEDSGSRSAEQEFVIVSESLGSFVVLDALQANETDAAPVRAVFERTFDLYFFANQFALLELGRLGRHDARADMPGMFGGSGASPLGALRSWAVAPQLSGARGIAPRQIVAFSDTSDMLTYHVPSIQGAVVANVHVRNHGFRLFGLFANPISAHAGHVDNDEVIDTLFR